ncbi:MAG TPA: exopolysaccharide Pel transporter PelG [Oscillatoriaceae cyanobacterium]
MAGIGFTLRRMLQQDGFSGPLKALTYAMVIAAGPWIASSTALEVLGALSPLHQGSQRYDIFLAIVSYVFAFSLIVIGFFQMVANRYLADRLFEGRWDFVSPAFAELSAPIFVVQALLAVAFLSFVPLDVPTKAMALLLYLAITGTWLAMIFLSAAKDYRWIVLAFFAGFFISVGGGVYGAFRSGLSGQLAGFTAGYLLTFFLLLYRLKREFGLPGLHPEAFWQYHKRFWPLAVTGLAYNLGIWIDKILFWYNRDAGRQVLGALHVSPLYDNAMFLAYLTIVPALGMFLLRVETDFYDTYRAYFAAIAAHERLETLLHAKREMARTLWRNLVLVLKVQAPITAFAIFFAPEIVMGLHLNWLSLFVFRYGALGAMLHVLHLMVLILLLYLEYRMEAMFLALVFFVSNTAFTLLAFAGGMPDYGIGYCASCGLTLLVGLQLLANAFRDLEYHVFMRLPLS